MLTWLCKNHGTRQNPRPRTNFTISWLFIKNDETMKKQNGRCTNSLQIPSWLTYFQNPKSECQFVDEIPKTKKMPTTRMTVTPTTITMPTLMPITMMNDDVEVDDGNVDLDAVDDGDDDDDARRCRH